MLMSFTCKWKMKNKNSILQPHSWSSCHWWSCINIQFYDWYLLIILSLEESIFSYSIQPLHLLSYAWYAIILYLWFNRVQCISCSKACHCSEICTNRPFRKEKKISIVKVKQIIWFLMHFVYYVFDCGNLFCFHCWALIH